MGFKFALPVAFLLALGATSAQTSIARPADIAGPWEISDGTSVDGIFLSIYTYLTDVPQPVIRQQTASIRVYHRENGRRETGGWFSTDANGGAAFDGRRLVIRHDFVLDVNLSEDRTRWTGTWTRGIDARNVVLERPHPSGSTVSPFVGDWDGIPRPQAPETHTRLHIAQSADGMRTAWMDREFSISKHHGELLEIVPSQPSAIVLQTTNPTGLPFQYRGLLSSDGNMLEGRWAVRGAAPETAASGRRLAAADRFRRVQ